MFLIAVRLKSWKCLRPILASLQPFFQALSNRLTLSFSYLFRKTYGRRFFRADHFASIIVFNVLTETGQGLAFGHNGLLSVSERKKGTAREGPSPFPFPNDWNVFAGFSLRTGKVNSAGHQMLNDL